MSWPYTDHWKAFLNDRDFEGDPQLYRNSEELAETQKRDPIMNFGNQLFEQGIATEENFSAAIQNRNAG